MVIWISLPAEAPHLLKDSVMPLKSSSLSSQCWLLPGVHCEFQSLGAKQGQACPGNKYAAKVSEKSRGNLGISLG